MLSPTNLQADPSSIYDDDDDNVDDDDDYVGLSLSASELRLFISQREQQIKEPRLMLLNASSRC